MEMRQKEVRPIIEEFYNFIGTLRPSKGSHLGAAVTYALNQKDKLLLFLDHPEVEMTNNLAERTVKPFVIDRKNFLFSATDKGADASALFMSVIETAKRNGLNVFGYLSYLMWFFLRGAKHLQKNSLTASCRGVLLCLKPATEHIIRSLKTWLRLSDSFSSTVFHSN